MAYNIRENNVEELLGPNGQNDILTMSDMKYLLVIQKLSQTQDVVRSSDLCLALGHSNAAVIDALKILKEKNCIIVAENGAIIIGKAEDINVLETVTDRFSEHPDLSTSEMDCLKAIDELEAELPLQNKSGSYIQESMEDSVVGHEHNTDVTDISEEEAQRETSEQAQRGAEEQTQCEAVERARQEAEEQAQREAVERARREAEEQAQREDAERVRREAEEQARKEAEIQTRLDSEAKEKQAKINDLKSAIADLNIQMNAVKGILGIFKRKKLQSMINKLTDQLNRLS